MLLPSTCFLACACQRWDAIDAVARASAAARDAQAARDAIDATSRERTPRRRRPLVTLSGYETGRGDDATLAWWRKTRQRTA